MIVLAASVAASSSERVWREFEWLQSSNRMCRLMHTFERLLFIHHNTIHVSKEDDFEESPHCNALYCEDDLEGIDLDVEDRKQQIRDRLQKAKDAVQVLGGDGELPSGPQSGEDA